MNVQTKPADDAAALVAELGRCAREAAIALRNASTGAKNRALSEAARLIRSEKAAILAANAKDMDAAKAAGMDAALQDRLLLNEARVEAMARGLDDIVTLPDPVGVQIEQWTRPNGLVISRVRVPIGIIGSGLTHEYDELAARVRRSRRVPLSSRDDILVSVADD